MTIRPTLRVARPTDDVEALLPFYHDGLGFEMLYRFTGHGSFDGIMLGHPNAPYHFEFTTAHGHRAGRAPTQDNLIILYLPDEDEWRAAVDRMHAAGFAPVPAFNAYRDRDGLTSRTRTGIASSSSRRHGVAKR